MDEAAHRVVSSVFVESLNGSLVATSAVSANGSRLWLRKREVRQFTAGDKAEGSRRKTQQTFVEADDDDDEEMIRLDNMWTRCIEEENEGKSAKYDVYDVMASMAGQCMAYSRERKNQRCPGDESGWRSE